MFDKIIDIIISILSIFVSDSVLDNINDIMREKKLRIIFFIFSIFVIVVISICIYISSISVTKVIINQSTLNMNVNDTQTLTATVLYSNNSTNNIVIWTSSNEAVAKIDQNGFITALSNGITIITAQASRNNTVESAECEVIVKSPPSGYSISVQQTDVDSYAYVYVQPYDDDVTKIQIYGKSPSGEIFTPNTDVNDLYHFYSECGVWTIYASIENDAGIYEANKPEDFVEIKVTNIKSTNVFPMPQNQDILSILQ